MVFLYHSLHTVGIAFAFVNYIVDSLFKRKLLEGAAVADGRILSAQRNDDCAVLLHHAPIAVHLERE